MTDAARGVPGARIDWVVEEGFAGIARMHGCVERVIPVAVRRWRGTLWKRSVWNEIASFRAALAAQPYDAVIDTQGLLKSALIARCAAGPRHGMDRASAREPLAALFYDRAHAVPRALHAVERNRRLTAASLDISLQSALDYGLRAGTAGPPGLPASYSVLLTMTSREDKLWPEPRWIELGRALGLPAVLPWGNAEERSRAERIARGIGEAAVPERMALEQLAQVLVGAKNVVGLDSGLSHLAAAFGAPAIAIFCGSDPALTGLYGAPRARNVGAQGRPPQVAEVLEALR
ncbi:MAG TPA: lipopolysaccharide heptosyltransferase I [Burkholderiales bacterium]|nr:lipopolysaccharide heptosyltransferase I [Burkholderiales bacterium]